MIGDVSLLFLANTDVSSAAGVNLVGDVIDLRVDDSRQAEGNDFSLVIKVAADFAGAGTVAFALASDSQEAIAVDGSESQHWKSDDFDFADLIQGTTIRVPLPSGFDKYERFLGLLVDGSATTTAGSISAELVKDVQDYRSLPDAVN